MSTFHDNIVKAFNRLTNTFDKSVAIEFNQFIEEEEIEELSIILNDIRDPITSSVIIEKLSDTFDWTHQKQKQFQTSLLTLFEIQPILPQQITRKTLLSIKTFTLQDECLMYGFVRECNIEWLVSTDIIHLLLLFCTIGDMFKKQYCNKKIIIRNNKNFTKNKYSSKYQTIETFGGLKAYQQIYHAFGSKIVTRVKYKWHLSVITETVNLTMYIGIVDRECIKLINKNERKFIPEKTYFFSYSNHLKGYGLCITTGDVYHKNGKYGKPYIINQSEIGRKNNIITIELDLTGKIYGSLKFIVHGLRDNKNKAEYWNDMCFAYDDILVHKKYQLAVAMGDRGKLILLQY